MALICAVGAVVYVPCLNGAFTYDDPGSIVGYSGIGDLGGLLRASFTLSGPLRAIPYLSLGLNYRLGGLEPFGYHAFNIAVHLGNAALVYALCRALLETQVLAQSVLAPVRSRLALASALVFAAHPLQSQAVAYVVQRMTSLVALFYLAALLVYLRSALRPASGSPPRRALAFASLAALAYLAARSKESAVTLPAAALLLDFFFLPRPRRARWPMLAALAAGVAVAPLHTLAPRWISAGHDAAQAAGSAFIDAEKMSRLDYFATQLSVVPNYLRLFAFPVGQSADHPSLVLSFAEPHVWLGAAVLGALCALTVWALRRSVLPGQGALRLVALGLPWALLTLAVESSFIPIKDVMVEHRMYLPSVGLVFAVVAALALLLRGLPSGAVAAVATSTLLALAGATWHRASLWGDPYALWTDVVRKHPEHHRGYTSLAELEEKRGNADLALQLYARAVSLQPDHVPSRYGLALQYLNRGRYAESAALLEGTLALGPSPVQAAVHNNLGTAYFELGRVDDAAAQYEAAVRVRPDFGEAHGNLGLALQRLGRRNEAIAHYRRALELKPGFPVAVRGLTSLGLAP